ncbi:MAG: aldo/keto reductase [Acidobacteria bacterium]|nr:aldo/keto reductase [Acidobacteriota bacterium]
MRYRALGRTGLEISAIALGTVSLGVDYGIAAPGGFGRPGEAAAAALIAEAFDRGVTLFDTAPAYGESERLIGRAIGDDPRAIVATKTGTAGIERSLDASRRALRRELLDIVQIHNATAADIADGRAIDALEEARRRGALRLIGASVYGEAAALAAIRSGRFDLVQVAFSVLDQRMAARVLPAAAASGVGVLIRSALLKGALSAKAQWLPPALDPLRQQAQRARDELAGGDWNALPSAAVRFCLSACGVSAVLAGVRTEAELAAALEAEAAGALTAGLASRAAALGLDDERLLNPSCWPVA